MMHATKHEGKPMCYLLTAMICISQHHDFSFSYKNLKSMNSYHLLQNSAILFTDVSYFCKYAAPKLCKHQAITMYTSYFSDNL